MIPPEYNQPENWIPLNQIHSFLGICTWTIKQHVKDKIRILLEIH